MLNPSNHVSIGSFAYIVDLFLKLSAQLLGVLEVILLAHL